MNWYRQIRELWQGKKVLGESVYKTAALLAGTAVSVNLFSITGGRVRLIDLTGRIVTVPAVGVGTILIRLQYDLAPGGAPTNMCIDSADIVGSPIGNLWTPDGVVGNALVDAGVTGMQASTLWSFVTTRYNLEPGVISLLQTVGTPPVTAGSIRWTLVYVPLDEGAIVSAA